MLSTQQTIYVYLLSSFACFLVFALVRPHSEQLLFSVLNDEPLNVLELEFCICDPKSLHGLKVSCEITSRRLCQKARLVVSLP